MKALSTDIIATIRDWTKAYVNNNRFDTTYLQIDALTGHLQAHQDANLKFTLLSDGHLKSEVI
ncbi:hypothetical protein [Enterocloster citroniae]|uniref:Uncharacterized protein n=2 Tax=Enterocloster citroniae TaxID=358743 RepID=A0ABV2G3V0_9FIRM|nr:hypothetical protein [Enterocloster citroniae]KMW23678.1 hypothetical protein HMPREF9470_00894 [[Clostridium] citroniae WAL-19142]